MLNQMSNNEENLNNSMQMMLINLRFLYNNMNKSKSKPIKKEKASIIAYKTP